MESVLEKFGSASCQEYNIQAITTVGKKRGCRTLGFWFIKGAPLLDPSESRRTDSDFHLQRPGPSSQHDTARLRRLRSGLVG